MHGVTHIKIIFKSLVHKKKKTHTLPVRRKCQQVNALHAKKKKRFCCDDHTKHINAICKQTVATSKVEADGTHNNYRQQRIK